MKTRSESNSSTDILVMGEVGNFLGVITATLLSLLHFYLLSLFDIHRMYLARTEVRPLASRGFVSYSEELFRELMY